MCFSGWSFRRQTRPSGARRGSNERPSRVALDRAFANNEPGAAIVPTASYTYPDEALKRRKGAMCA
jgi:hypothetical protein